MDKKFVVFQVGLVIFGIVLFLALADLKKRMIEKRMTTEQEVVVREGECGYHSLLGQVLSADLIRKTGAYPIILPDDINMPDLQLSRVGGNDTIVIYFDKKMKIVRIRCL